MAEMLEVKNESLAEVVENKIFEYLKTNHLAPGSKLPTEEKLATMFAVSRRSVRESLSRLRMFGLLESKKRRGLVVSSPSIFHVLEKVIDPLFLSAEAQSDFYKLRLAIEFGIGELLAIYITPEQLRELETIVEKEEAHPEDFNLYLQCDVEFHSLLYHASGRWSRFRSFSTGFSMITTPGTSPGDRILPSGSGFPAAARTGRCWRR